MTAFDQRRLTNETLRLDLDGLRRGKYSDRYFANIVAILSALEVENYTFSGQDARPLPVPIEGAKTGEVVVEAQIFNRRQPQAVVAGVDVALAMLRHATGYFDDDRFVETWDRLGVEAVDDGVLTHYAGNTEDVQPVIRVRGCYRDFALLETPILGVLTRASRIATAVYEVMQAANGKTVLFFPARFDAPEVQPLDGYAYWLAVQRYNHEKGFDVPAVVSTDAQGAWWGGRGSGTIPHALIAAFLGDTAEAMVQFARILPVEVPRIALVDFNNDTIGDSLGTMARYWPRYRDALTAGDEHEARRWTLAGVRLDTSAAVRDRSLGPDDPTGVNAVLVRRVRAALDEAWREWSVPAELTEAAREFCRNVKIVVTGGFNSERIAEYERDGVPADMYGVGSSLLRNDTETNTDYTMDVVRVQLNGEWVDVPKVGRRPNDNPQLQPVDLREL